MPNISAAIYRVIFGMAAVARATPILKFLYLGVPMPQVPRFIELSLVWRRWHRLPQMDLMGVEPISKRTTYKIP